MLDVMKRDRQELSEEQSLIIEKIKNIGNEVHAYLSGSSILQNREMSI